MSHEHDQACNTNQGDPMQGLNSAVYGVLRFVLLLIRVSMLRVLHM